MNPTPPARPPIRASRSAFAPLWPDTQPMMDGDDLAFDTGGFREALDGLQVRELNSPDLFQHLFGRRR